jgi:RNA recognition motif-containing protein
MKVFIGNLSYAATESDIAAMFDGYVPSNIFVARNLNGEGRGWAMVFIDDLAASQAIGKLDGTEFMGRRLAVSPAKNQR